MEALIICACALAGTALLVLAVWLILVAPGAKRGVTRFKGQKFAHRGLHGEGVAENSLSAFRAATEAGFGIELDVRLSSDGVLVVFHDDTLDRVVGREGRVDRYTAAELADMRLSGTDDGVPTFAEVLELVNGRVPLLVEIKEDQGNSRVSETACAMLAEYKGDYLVESFNPLSLSVVAKKLPEAARGILSHRYYDYEQYRKPLYFLLQSLLFNRICRPAFVAYDHRHASAVGLRLSRALGATTFAWTVKSAEDEKRAMKNGFDGIIFEGYIPEK